MSGGAEGGEEPPRVPFSFLLSGSGPRGVASKFPRLSRPAGDGWAQDGRHKALLLSVSAKATVPDALAGPVSGCPGGQQGLGRAGQRGPSSGSDVVRNADGAGLTRLHLLLGPREIFTIPGLSLQGP